VKRQIAILSAGSFIILSMAFAAPLSAQTVYRELPPPSYQALPPDSAGRVIYVPPGYRSGDVDDGPSARTTVGRSTPAAKRAARRASAKARAQAKAAKTAPETDAAKAESATKANAASEPETTATVEPSPPKIVEPPPAVESSSRLALPPARRIIDPNRPVQTLE
jgi:hypothetical protein